MERALPAEYNPYFQGYMNLVPDGELVNVLKENTHSTSNYFQGLPTAKHNYRYAEDKWTIKELVMHIIDTERVLGYRLLVAARGDKTTPLHSFDEDLYASNIDVSNRSIEDLLLEFKAVRYSTERIAENLTDEQSKFMADNVTYPITARALIAIMVGHTHHHINVINERYL